MWALPLSAVCLLPQDHFSLLSYTSDIRPRTVCGSLNMLSYFKLQCLCICYSTSLEWLFPAVLWVQHCQLFEMSPVPSGWQSHTSPNVPAVLALCLSALPQTINVFLACKSSCFLLSPGLILQLLSIPLDSHLPLIHFLFFKKKLPRMSFLVAWDQKNPKFYTQKEKF